MDQAKEWSQTRLVLAALGAAGSWSGWALAELLPQVIDNARLLLGLSITVIGFFIVLMSLAGPSPVRRAALPALGLSVGVAALTLWASFRFSTLEPLLDNGHAAAALFVIYLVATPFISVRLEHGAAHQLDYDKLFQTAWGMIVRALAATLFTGLFWGVLFLCDALLGLVGINIIEEILEIDPMPFVISGAVMGLAIAVAHEWRAYVSPHLLLRLFRLLVPVVVPVLALFVVSVALSGLEGTLNFFSETGLLTAVAIGGITLVTVSVDRDAGHQVVSAWMVWMVRALAVLLLPVALLALWGIGARVLQYGWTPQRVLAALCVLNISLYAVAYAALALWRGDWMRRLRRANVALALWTLALAVLWLTPVLNAERLSANSQVQRILQGRATPDQAAIWELSHDWGRAGQRALYSLRSTPDYPQRAQIITLIERAEGTDSRWNFEKEANTETRQDLAQKLHALMPVYPQGRSLPPAAFADLREHQLSRMIDGCETLSEDGAPGCLFLFVPFRPDGQTPEGLLLFQTKGAYLTAGTYQLIGGKLKHGGSAIDPVTGGIVRFDAQMMKNIREGGYEITPAPVNVLTIGGATIFPNN